MTPNKDKSILTHTKSNMENSETEPESQHSFNSPPRRRRSTFFEKRESIAPQPQKDIGSENTKSNNCDEYDHTMSRYYDQMTKEKDEWKREVIERKNKYNDLKQQIQLECKSTARSRISYSSLTSEDIEFLKGKPNIAKLSESQMHLHKSVREARALYSRASELDNVILSNCEGRIKTITQYILDNSTIEPMES